jgi:hypothetical protein
MSSRAFQDLCKGVLQAGDLALLALCTLEPDVSPPGGPSYGEPPKPCSSAFINNWRNWERALRLNLARYRAQRLKREGGAAVVDPPDYPADATAAAKTAASMDSPLEAEIFLDKARWDAIELFQGIEYFSSNTIFAYLLKLRLLERRALFKAEEGFTEYKGLYASITEQPENASKRVESGVPK